MLAETRVMITIGLTGLACLLSIGQPLEAADGELRVGVAQVEITPPLGFPMSGYYHERLATGTIDPLWAKGIVFRDGDTQAAWVVCDLTGISIDLSTEVRRQAAKATGIPAANIVISATHSHTAPDYYKSLYQFLGPPDATLSQIERERAAYAGRLIENIVAAIVSAQANALPAQLASGSTTQSTPVSFCRRFVMKDGSVRTWVGLKHPEALRATAEIDPEISLLKIQPTQTDAPSGLISNFALHLDTVGGMEWSADYPFAIERTVRTALGPQAISMFGTGCCGDINHADPTGQPRRKSTEIGDLLGTTIVSALPDLSPIERPRLQVRTRTVPLPLEEVSPADVLHSLELIKTVNSGQKIDFFDHVLAYKRLVLDNLTNSPPHPESVEFLSLGRTHTWKGVGATLPTEVTVITLGSEVALVFLPGEVFAELGMAIKRASPFRTTLVVELCHCVESIYIPNQHAYAGGGYEVANSLVQPGSGERLVETAVDLLRASATEPQMQR